MPIRMQAMSALGNVMTGALMPEGRTLRMMAPIGEADIAQHPDLLTASSIAEDHRTWLGVARRLPKPLRVG
jgi:hypothetical protein